MSTRKIDSPGKWLAEEVERIRERRDLSDEGKLAHLGRAYRTAKSEADKHRRATEQAWNDQLDSILRKLMAPRTHNAEWRQLREEALAVTKPEDAMRRLEAAITTGDDLEARAYGAAALDKAMSGMPGADAWVDVVNTWGRSDSYIDDSLTALSQHHATKPSAQQRLMDQAGVSKPAELRDNPQWEQLIDIADSEDRADMTDQAKRAEDNEAVTFRGDYYRDTPFERL